MAHRLLLGWKKERLLNLLLHISFLLDTIGAFIDFLVCMYVISLCVRYYKARYCCFIHYFATTHAAVVGNFIVCKSTTSVTRIFLWRHDATTFRSLIGPWNKLLICKKKRIPVDEALTLKKRRESCSPFNIKMKCVYNYCVQRCVFYESIPVPSICNQSIPIDTNLSIDWYW